jgi:hypothetical protein
MKRFSLPWENGSTEPSQFQLLMPKELALVRLSQIINVEDCAADLQKIFARSSEAFLHIDLVILEKNFQELETLLQRFNIKNICLRLPMDPVSAERLQWAGYARKDEDVFETFVKIQGRLPTVKICPEIDLDGDLHLLGPILAQFTRIEPDWIALFSKRRPEGAQLQAVKDGFLHLRINQTKKIPMHFFLTADLSEEWNLKSNNLFNGPKYVHLDIANTCTHSCIFCGLYSPAAMEHHKEKTGKL